MRNHILFVFIIFLTLANVLVWSLLGLEKAYADKVYPGITIDNQSLSGLTKNQVVDRLAPIHDQMLKEKVTLTLAGKTYDPTLEELGYQVDTTTMANAILNIGRGSNVSKILSSVFEYRKSKTIPLSYTIDQGKFDNYLNEIGKSVIKEPKNLSLDYKDGQIIVVPGEDGVTLNKEELRSAIQEKVRPGKPARITLTYGSKSPEINNETQVAEAKERLTKLLAKPLTLQAEEVSIQLTPDTIYTFVYYEVENGKLTVKINEDTVRTYLSTVAKKVDIDPVTKQISAVNNSVLNEGKDGRELNVPSSMQKILERLAAADYETPLSLPVDKKERKTATISPEYVLGRYPGRYLEVDLSAQRIHLLEGENYHRTFLISTGKWDMPTPTGELQIHNHIKTAFSKRYGLYMDNWMAITSNGEYGLHQLPRWPDGRVEGTNHLGKPVSHGCIRLGPGDAEYLYNWASNGTKVFIHT